MEGAVCARDEQESTRERYATEATEPVEEDATEEKRPITEEEARRSVGYFDYLK